MLVYAGDQMRVITMGKAAVNRSFKRGQLKAAPYILTVKSGAAVPMGRFMDVAEMKDLYEAAMPHVQIFIAWMLGTAARTEAILDLHSRQLDDDLVDLNPPGRTQTKKYRPTVRLIPSLAERPWDGFLVVAKSRHVRTIKKGWAAAKEASGLEGAVTSYSLRLSAARAMRKAGVSEWDVQTQLGHRRPGPTETYTAFDPDYLKRAADVLDNLVRAVCVRLPVREVRTFRRNCKEIQRDGWWAL